MPSPAVSVIIPCFNLGEYLDEAVASVLSQTFQDFEILIVDDGSTDSATVHLFEHYARPRTQVFRTPNRGLAAARNYLISRATGKYLCALDADDKLHPQFLEKTVGVLESDPSLAFVSPHLQMFGEEEHIWPEESACDLATLLFDDTVITPALVRRELVEALGGYDERMPHQGDEDWDLWISLVEAGHHGVIIPDVLFFYRRRRGSMCEQCTSGQTHLDLVEYIVRKHRESYRLHARSVLLRKEGRIAGLRRANVGLEMNLAELVPTVERRRSERDALRARLEAAEARRIESKRGPQESAAEMAALSHEYHRALNEVQALRSSLSWRVTAPLRWAYDAITFRRRR
jgi:glycosyltransferase involved in cell wall biosynthesis